MPSKKRRSVSSDSPRWQVILENIESQNRLTGEAVAMMRQTMDERFDHVERESAQRYADLASAMRGVDRKLERVDARLRVVETKVDELIPLVARVSALEHRHLSD